MLNKLFYSLVAIVIGLSCITTYANIPTVPATQTATTTPTGNNTSLVFVQTATSGSIEPIKNHPGYYYLLLINTNPYVAYFTQRPLRTRGLIPVNQFMKAWQLGSNNLKINNPNGIIIAAKINGEDNTEETNLLVTISNPAYLLSRNIMRYVVKPLYSQPLFSSTVSLRGVTLVFGS